MTLIGAMGPKGLAKNESQTSWIEDMDHEQPTISVASLLVLLPDCLEVT